MKNLLRSGGLLALVIIVTGCLENRYTFNINKDGSGTIEVRALFGPMILQQLKQLAAVSGANGRSIDEQLLDRTQYEDQAAQFGEGVSLVSVILETNTQGFKGTKALFKFDDINKLNIDKLKPGQQGPNLDLGYTFLFEPGETARLSLTSSKSELPESAEEVPLPSEAEIQQQIEMLNMFAGAKIAVVIKVNGTIVETNASVADKSAGTIELVSMDLDKMKENPETMKRVFKIPQDDVKALSAAKIPGLHLEDPAKVLTISFQ